MKIGKFSTNRVENTVKFNVSLNGAVRNVGISVENVENFSTRTETTKTNHSLQKAFQMDYFLVK